MDTLCTCGHTAAQHNSLGVCFATTAPGEIAGLCPCPDFVTDDVALAAAVGVLVPEQRKGGQ